MSAPIKTYLTTTPAKERIIFFFEKHCLKKEKPVFLGRQYMPLLMAFLRSEVLQKLILFFFFLLATTPTSEPICAHTQHSLTKVCHCLSYACLLNYSTQSGVSNFKVKPDCCTSKEQHSAELVSLTTAPSEVF